ncbi:hypothetical protein [Shewanella fidelis]|uniref:Transcriptional regulator n=1 Tax=Shewanella fidelis TaxID=173509 RepID=A0AAW8NMC9_9GAMM|nr:hypothetical protein [Shewanella fidelis]MDR8523857.1 hypothetical protein [Shewanella fidelis]MDW4810405.1 hypothetical protein [Shewanella fidelis]MDW4823708.1 hypothetical protein [Shewanella fidelis]
MQPSELLDLVKAASGLTSDYQVMKKFGFSQTGVSHWRINRSYPKNSVLIQFAEILHMNAGLLMMYSLEWREKDEAAKAQISQLINAIHHAKFDDSFIGESV